MSTEINRLEEDIKHQPRKAPYIAEQHTQFGKTKDEYEREFNILQSIKSAKFIETIVVDLEIDPIQYHKYGCPQEIQQMMDARKVKP